MGESTFDSSQFVELEFEITDDRCFFLAASDRLDCTVAIERQIERSDDTALEFLSFEGASAVDVLDVAESFSSVERHRVVRAREDTVLVEVVISGPCFVRTFADTDAIIDHAVATDGVALLRVAIYGETVPDGIADIVSAAHPETRLVAKRHRDSMAPFVTDEFGELVSELTDRQYRVLRTAVAAGYFEWPRRSTATECAEALGISQPTFSQHLRRAQSKVLSSVVKRTMP